jgi:hypothetical protein
MRIKPIKADVAIKEKKVTANVTNKVKVKGRVMEKARGKAMVKEVVATEAKLWVCKIRN